MARRRRCAIPNPRRRRAWRGGAIAIEDLVFAYPGTSVDVLRGVDLEIAAGETLALVGPSGAGKTTLDQLLLRFFDPARGRLAPARAGLRCGDGGAFRIARGHRLGRRCRGPC